MPDAARSIVVSGGVEAIPPKTIGCIPRFVNIAPDVVSNSIMCQEGVAPDEFIVLGTAPSDATTEILQTEGCIYPSGGVDQGVCVGQGNAFVAGSAAGQIAVGYKITVDTSFISLNINNLLLGGSIVADDTGLQGMKGNVVIGFGLSLLNQASNNILMGQAIVSDGSESNCVLIGNTVTVLGAGFSGNLVAVGNQTRVASRSVAIGDRAVAGVTLAGDCVAIGQQASAEGPQAIGIGRICSADGSSGVAVGVAAAANFDESVALGHNSQTTASFQFVCGGGTGEIRNVIFGRGDTSNSSPAFVGTTIRLTNNANGGTPDTVGPPLDIQGGTGLGDAIGGIVTVNAPIPIASGLGLQSMTPGLRVQPSTTATETFLRIRDVDNGTLEIVSVGAADSGGLGFKLLRIPN